MKIQGAKFVVHLLHSVKAQLTNTTEQKRVPGFYVNNHFLYCVVEFFVNDLCFIQH